MEHFKTGLRQAERITWVVAAALAAGYLLFEAFGLQLYAGYDVYGHRNAYFAVVTSMPQVPWVALGLALLATLLRIVGHGPIAERYSDWWLRRLEESRWRLALSLARKHADSPTTAVVAMRRRSGLTVASSQDLMRRALAEVAGAAPKELETPIIIEMEKERV